MVWSFARRSILVKINTVSNFIFFSIAAIVASLLRWQINDIFAVNIIGCFILGYINALNLSEKFKLIYGFAFCGSLTTFSGWILQLFKLISSGFSFLLFITIFKIIFFATFAIYLGNLLGQKVNKLY